MQIKSKEILITGDCGFIGSNIAKTLAKDTCVKILDNLSSGSLENINDFKGRVGFIKCDIRRNIVSAFKDIDIVFPLVANIFINKSIEKPQYDGC